MVQPHAVAITNVEAVHVENFTDGEAGVAKAIDNTPSRRISEKQGMRLIGVEDRDYVSGRLPSELWEITAEEWRAWKVRNWKN